MNSTICTQLNRPWSMITANYVTRDIFMCLFGECRHFWDWKTGIIRAKGIWILGLVVLL